MSGVSAVVLAAGAGSRFGGGKLLAPFAGKTLIETTLSGLRGAPVDETIVVVREDAEELGEVCEPYGARIAENPDWAAGMSTSVRTGLAAVGPEVRAAVFLLADQPLVGRRRSPGSWRLSRKGRTWRLPRMTARRETRSSSRGRFGRW